MRDSTGSTQRLQAALARADDAANRRTRAPVPTKPPRECVVLGDPQAPIARLFAVLDHQGLITSQGWLRPDIGLIAIGDYFDFADSDPVASGLQGVRFLAWLAAHDPSQVTILLGNHDLERVQSLGGCTQAEYAEARQAGHDMLRETGPAARRAWLQRWIASHPEHPPVGAAKAYRSFVVEQRNLVQNLLLAGRMQLAASVIQADGRQALVTHAGISRRECDLFDLSCDVDSIASDLNMFLLRAVDRVRDNWSTGGNDRLDITPLYYAWEPTRPNGGAFIHRPDEGDVPDHENPHGLDPAYGPRSQKPDEFLYLRIDQIVGHTIAAKSLMGRLKPIVTPAAAIAGVGPLLRLARINGRTILGTMLETAADRECSMCFVDVAMAITDMHRVDLLRVYQNPP